MIACIYGSIEWTYPQSGFGVQYRCGWERLPGEFSIRLGHRLTRFHLSGTHGSSYDGLYEVGILLCKIFEKKPEESLTGEIQWDIGAMGHSSWKEAITQSGCEVFLMNN
jgi:hypothetical protein